MTDSLADFASTMQELLTAITSEPKGSYARQEAEKRMAMFIQATHRGPTRPLRIIGGDED
jgi:hypothetical protein